MAPNNEHPTGERNSRRCDQPLSRPVPLRISVTNEHRPWAVLLAGDDGVPLRSLTAKITRDSLPKQFCPLLVENESLLHHTYERIWHVFSEDHTVFVVTQAHQRWRPQDLQQTPMPDIIVQPRDRGTGVAMTLALLQVLTRDANAIVAFFPCDHVYSDEIAFAETIKFGLAVAEEHPDCITLLGAEASSPDVEYGWIELGPLMPNTCNRHLMRVNRFWEKPPALKAAELFQRGCLWNMFVTIGFADTFLELLCSQIPNVVASLSQNLAAYEDIRSVDFCRDVMANEPHRVLVIQDAPGRTDWKIPGG